jgi:hypothetical protein
MNSYGKLVLSMIRTSATNHQDKHIQGSRLVIYPVTSKVQKKLNDINGSQHKVYLTCVLTNKVRKLHAAGGKMLDFCLVIIISLFIYFFCYSKGYLSFSPQDPVAKLTLSHHLHVEFKTCIFSNNNNLVISARQQIGYEFKSALNTNTSRLRSCYTIL